MWFAGVPERELAASLDRKQVRVLCYRCWGAMVDEIEEPGFQCGANLAQLGNLRVHCHKWQDLEET